MSLKLIKDFSDNDISVEIDDAVVIFRIKKALLAYRYFD